jgi:hypothetical protein
MIGWSEMASWLVQTTIAAGAATAAGLARATVQEPSGVEQVGSC